MSKNILIRDLSEDLQSKLDKIREGFGEKTNSKTIQTMIEQFGSLQDTVLRLRQENQNKQERSSSLEEFFKTIKQEVNEFKREEEDYEDWD